MTLAVVCSSTRATLATMAAAVAAAGAAAGAAACSLVLDHGSSRGGCTQPGLDPRQQQKCRQAACAHLDLCTSRADGIGATQPQQEQQGHRACVSAHKVHRGLQRLRWSNLHHQRPHHQSDMSHTRSGRLRGHTSLVQVEHGQCMLSAPGRRPPVSFPLSIHVHTQVLAL